jgi:hypothetical protein
MAGGAITQRAYDDEIHAPFEGDLSYKADNGRKMTLNLSSPDLASS